MKTSTRFVVAVAIALFTFAVACEEEGPTEPTRRDCSDLDYWTTDGRGGCIAYEHRWDSIRRLCVPHGRVIRCP